tara:strand:+ start:952 stop:1851 length:900 start_codon:yes stop_codon:yes gene_type:complete
MSTKAEQNFKKYVSNHQFLSNLENVDLNFGAVVDDTEHPLEQIYLGALFKILKKWDGFVDFQFYIIGSNEKHDFVIDSNSVVIYLSNENHEVPSAIRKAKAVFTPYCPLDFEKSKNIFPIPLGYNGSLEDIELIAIEDRVTDYFFSGNIYKKRLPFYAGIKYHQFKEKINITQKQNAEVIFTNGFGCGFPPSEYSKKLMNSKIAIVPEGYLSDVSFRFFEASKYGSIIITKKLYNYWFFKDFPGFQLNSWFELSALLIHLKKNPEKMKEIQKATLKYYEDNCSEKSVANYIINQLTLLN